MRSCGMGDRLLVALLVLAAALALIGVASLRAARRERRLAGYLYRMTRALLVETELAVEAAEVVDERRKP